MLDRERIVDTIKRKIEHAKGIDRDFVFLPVWQAKELLEYLQPMKPRKTNIGYICDRCGNELVNHGSYKQKHCDECGQRIDWEVTK